MAGASPPLFMGQEPIVSSERKKGSPPHCWKEPKPLPNSMSGGKPARTRPPSKSVLYKGEKSLHSWEEPRTSQYGGSSLEILPGKSEAIPCTINPWERRILSTLSVQQNGSKPSGKSPGAFPPFRSQGRSATGLLFHVLKDTVTTFS